MSDNIKLVIEIPEPIYDRIKYLESNADTMLDKLMRAVQNGIPLDTVKAEIKRMEYHMIDCDVLVSQEEVLEILDNIGKESEDTVRNARKVTKKDSHKEWWDSFYKGEVKPNE